jgi:hypothetical protein
VAGKVEERGVESNGFGGVRHKLLVYRHFLVVGYRFHGFSYGPVYTINLKLKPSGSMIFLSSSMSGFGKSHEAAAGTVRLRSTCDQPLRDWSQSIFAEHLADMGL